MDNNQDFDIEIVELQPEDQIDVIEISEDPILETTLVAETELPEMIEVSDDSEDAPIEYSEWQTPEDFEHHVVAALRSVPTVYANSKSSLKRAFAYLEKVSEEILQGLEQDAPYAALSEQQLRTFDVLEEGIDEAMKNIAAAVRGEPKIIKTATKSSAFTYFVNPFVFGLARVLINGKVSQGKNIEELYKVLNAKYKLNEREQLELYFTLNDLGYPIRSSFVDGVDMSEQYQA